MALVVEHKVMWINRVKEERREFFQGYSVTPFRRLHTEQSSATLCWRWRFCRRTAIRAGHLSGTTITCFCCWLPLHRLQQRQNSMTWQTDSSTNTWWP